MHVTKITFENKDGKKVTLEVQDFLINWKIVESIGFPQLYLDLHMRKDGSKLELLKDIELIENL